MHALTVAVHQRSVATEQSDGVVHCQFSKAGYYSRQSFDFSLLSVMSARHMKKLDATYMTCYKTFVHNGHL